jgi:hypothetical protein
MLHLFPLGLKYSDTLLYRECLPCHEVFAYILLTFPHVFDSRVTEVWESTVTWQLCTYYDVQYPNTTEVYMWYLQNVSEITSYQIYTKQYNYFSYISFKEIVPLRKYTFLSATLRVLETFLEAILWKPFHSPFAFLIRPITSQSAVLSVLISVQGTVKTAEAKSGECGRCCSVVTLLFVKKSLNKTDRCAGA